MTEPAEYPRELERKVSLDDGTRVRIRTIRPDDEARLIALHSRLSRDSRYHRFFSDVRRLPQTWAHSFAIVDYQRRLALVAEGGSAEEPVLIGVGRYEPTDEAETVEVAFVVEDRWQDKGLGRILLQDLLRAAEARGIHRFRAYVLPDNAPMLRLLSRETSILERKTEGGIMDIVFTRAAASSPS